VTVKFPLLVSKTAWNVSGACSTSFAESGCSNAGDGGVGAGAGWEESAPGLSLDEQAMTARRAAVTREAYANILVSLVIVRSSSVFVLHHACPAFHTYTGRAEIYTQPPDPGSVQMPHAEDTLALIAYPAVDGIKSIIADIAFRANQRGRENRHTLHFDSPFRCPFLARHSVQDFWNPA
jgi:hypothetical protein